MSDWKMLEEVVRVRSKWVTLVGERWLCDKGKQVEYWRVEKADSVIVLPVRAGELLCVQPTFRPGVGRKTLDFPGGRLPGGMRPEDLVPPLLARELGVAPDAVERVTPLNSVKWLVNSSFSDQGLWGFVAQIDAEGLIPDSQIGARVPADESGAKLLMDQLDCLQCRAVLSEWLRVIRLS